VAAEALVETLLERRREGDLAEAEAAIDRMEDPPVDFRWAARDIAVLRLRALLSQRRGEEAAYQDLAQRYRSDGDITWL
jgi:adenylate cyclase